MMLALLLGAGFSKWAAGLPLGAELFDFAIAPFGIREQRRLERVKCLKTAWDEINRGMLAEQFIAAVLSSENARDQGDVLWYLARRLAQPYIWEEWQSGRVKRHVLMIDEHRKWERVGVMQTSSFLTLCGIQLSGIVTLNYDMLVEYALGSGRFNYGAVEEVIHGRGPYPLSHWRTPFRATGRLPLAKLHGSISWDVSGKYTDGRRAISGRPLIVAPTPEKEAHPALKDQWTLSSQILRRASRLIVFGFGFNEYDQAVLAHLSEAGRNLSKVGIVDICSRVAAAELLWPHARVLSFHPPPGGLDELRGYIAGN